MEYFLQSEQSGRVFIDSSVRDDCLVERTIEADSWVSARNQVDENEFVPIPGHGYFIDFFQANRDCR